MIRALIFDFDGLILDTETAGYMTWQAIYREHGCELPLEKWEQVLGSDSSMGGFDIVEYLKELSGQPVVREAVLQDRLARRMEILAAQPVLPGVVEHIDAAKRRGLRLAVASSSSREWVDGHLKRLGLRHRFQAVLTADDVQRVKPAPDLFLAACRAVGVRPHEAIVLEDSPHGVEAARRAGIFVVAVPNPLMRHLDLSQANLVLHSLADRSLDDLIDLAENGHRA